MIYLILFIIWIMSSMACASEMDNAEYKDGDIAILIFIALCPIVNTLHIIKSVRNKRINFIKDFKKYF